MPAERIDVRTAAGLAYAILLALTARWVFAWDETIALVVYCGLLLPAFALMRWPNAPLLLMTGFTAMLLGKLIYGATVNPLNGPDEIHYFEQVTTFARLSEYMPYAMEHIRTQWMNISAVPIFGMLYMPFFKWLELENPLAIILLNTVLLLLIVNAAYRLNDGRFGYTLPPDAEGRDGLEDGAWRPKHSFAIVTVVGLLLSPSLMYMSSLFAKDITCVLLGLYGTILLLRKQWLLFIVVMLYATGLRDYAIIYTLSFYFLYAQKLRSAIVMAVGALLLIVWQVGPLSLINAGMLSVFLFISPNPINPANWEPKLMMRTMEALFMTIMLGMSVFYALKYKETRRFYLMAALLIFTYACVLVLVGYATVTGRSLDYGIGTIGDNMVRKKLPIVPVIYTISAYTLVWCRYSFRPKHQKIQTSDRVKNNALIANAISTRAKGADPHAGTR
ncbi:hypothetical protein [Paenibacillus sp. NEAU-GSW1]|uniref:hypothetical protein n=1 Tax=Paenibacillus sp. NEAU-GSW1 TaxID=2682486 RepID=UPI0012E17565|nr:hypothetical protein [Paenibacillus sp. NEAU-GSW1]MUT64772.1 hypothetical protein [Paenibacillus sp. NEAU-GSW1]